MPAAAAENTGSEVGAKGVRRSDCNSLFNATNEEITKCAREGPDVLHKLVLRFVQEDRQLNGVNIATVFYSCAKLPNMLGPDVLKYLLNALHGASLCGQSIGNIGYGLQGFEDTPIVRELLALLTLKIRESTEKMTAQQVGNALYGLKGITDSPEARSFLHAMEPKLQGVRGVFSSQAVGNACFGLQQLGDSPQVRSIIDAIAGRLEEATLAIDAQDAVSKIPFGTLPHGSLRAALLPKVIHQDLRLNGQAISNSLYGLQTIGDTPQTRRLVSLIACHLEQITAPLKAQEVAIALYGLRCFQGAPEEVQRLLVALAWQIRVCTGRFNVRYISSSFCGLRWLGDCVETRSVLASLTEKVKCSAEPFDSRTIGNCLYGMQSFGCSEEALCMLQALVPHVERCTSSMTPQQIGSSFYGLHSVGDSLETRKMLVALSGKLEELYALDPQAISNTLYGLHDLGNAPQTKQVLRALMPKIISCKAAFNPQVFANSFFGLQSMENSTEVRGILAALASKFAECSGPFNVEYLASMIYNLRSIGDCEEVRLLLRLMKPKISESSMPAESIAKVFQGLRRLGDSSEVTSMFQAMALHVQYCQSMAAHHICICLSALKAIRDLDAIRHLVRVLGSKVLQCSEPMKDSHVAGALQGLRGLGDVQDVQQVRRALEAKACSKMMCAARRSYPDFGT
jgi:hypothetical protein